MNKKCFIAVLCVLVLLTLSFSAAQEVANSTVDDSMPIGDTEVSTLNAANDTEYISLSLDDSHNLTANEDNSTVLKSSSPQIKTQIDVKSTTTFDVVGGIFKVKLSDENKNPINNSKVTFTINGVTYKDNTDDNGIASLKLRLSDGTYKITSKFYGSSKYLASSKTTTITISNTRVVEEGLSNAEIQSIIDNAKANNVILFKGNSYEDVNLIINKRLTLISYSNTQLKSSSSSPVITVRGKEASLSGIYGFAIQGNGNGLLISDSDYVTIRNNDISTKANAIVVSNAKYLNITVNNIFENSNNGITVANSTYIYISNNNIFKNGGDAIVVAKSENVFIFANQILNNKGNGVYLTNKIGNINYGNGPHSIHIDNNTISKNDKDGIFVSNAGNDVNINYNVIVSNEGNGIALATIGNNKIQSNVITDNGDVGLNFIDDYVNPKSQDISYNAIFSNRYHEIEARTYTSSDGKPLKIGDNWYSDKNTLCPKIKTNNIKFVVKQIGDNQFQASFIDSKGNIASLLPDRTLYYTTNNGQSIPITISGGSGVFTVDANDGDLIKAVVDDSRRDNTYQGNIPNPTDPNIGQTPTYTYPGIPDYQLYEDIEDNIENGNDDNLDDGSGNWQGNGNGNGNGGGNGKGNGNGRGDGGNTNKGNGTSSQESDSFTGNSSVSQKTDPASGTSNPVNDVSQSSQTQSIASPDSASESSAGNTADSSSGSKPESVAKQIVIDEDDFYKITGISFIILLIIFTISYYYKDDIIEMKSKM